MSVSSHLTPDPERRLWIILGDMRHSVEWADKKVGALTAFAAFQAVFISNLAQTGTLGSLVLVLLCACLPLGVFAFSPLTGMPKRLPYLDPPRDKPSAVDRMIDIEDISQYSHGELVLRLDEYLGGGITSTQYYEDIVGEIVMGARVATRKLRLFRVCCLLVGLAQLILLAQAVHG